jgi:hypothetical protein
MTIGIHQMYVLLLRPSQWVTASLELFPLALRWCTPIESKVEELPCLQSKSWSSCPSLHCVGVLLLKVKWKNCHACKVKVVHRVHPTSSSSFTLLSKDVYSMNLVVSYSIRPQMFVAL